MHILGRKRDIEVWRIVMKEEKKAMWVDTKSAKEICGYHVIENNRDYCVVEICGKMVKVDCNGCASEHDLCFIDNYGLPHSTSYLNPNYRCELDKMDNALMTDLSENERRIVHEWIRDTFNPIKTPNRQHSTYSLKHLLQEKTGVYITNNQMKHALINMGYTCQNEHQMNWFVNVSEMGIKYIK